VNLITEADFYQQEGDGFLQAFSELLLVLFLPVGVIHHVVHHLFVFQHLGEKFIFKISLELQGYICEIKELLLMKNHVPDPRLGSCLRCLIVGNGKGLTAGSKFQYSEVAFYSSWTKP
jgi:hypothetical protein